MDVDPDKHREKMKQVKQAKDKMYDERDEEKGLLMVHTGTGKGKTTAAMGMVLRALGHGMKVGVVQYVKGTIETAEQVVLTDGFPDRIDFHRMGEGFTWETQDRETDRRAAEQAWDQSKSMVTDETYDYVLLDELNIVLDDELLDLDEVLDTLTNKPEDMHVCVTGRRAPQKLQDAADLVTEMRRIKHHFNDQGVGAQPGVEY